MADSLTQEKVREAVARLQNVVADYDREFAAFGDRSWFRDDEVDCNPAHLRTLLAAYTRMETDMAEARRLMEPFEEISTRYPREPDHANVEMFVGLAPFRALAAFYNKGEE